MNTIEQRLVALKQKHTEIAQLQTQLELHSAQLLVDFSDLVDAVKEQATSLLPSLVGSEVKTNQQIETNRQDDLAESCFQEVASALREHACVALVSEHAKEETDEGESDYPLYPGAYLHVESLADETVLFLGQKYPVTISNTGQRMWVGRETQIVHLVDYERVDQYGEVKIDEEGWMVFNETCFIVRPFPEATIKVSNGTKCKIVDYAELSGLRTVNPGTLAVRYSDYNYPDF